MLSASSIGERCGEQVRRLYSVFGESRRSFLLTGDNRRPSLQEAGNNRRPSLQEAGDKDEYQRTVRESPAKQEEGTRLEGSEGEVKLLYIVYTKSKVEDNANAGNYQNYQNGALNNQLTALEGGGVCLTENLPVPKMGVKIPT